MIQKLKNNLLKIYLFIFPFGQLLRLDLHYQDQRLTVLAIDCVVGFLATLWFFTTSNRSRIITGFTLSLMFSYIFSLSIFPFKSVIVGGLYMIRILAYYMFYFAIKEGVGVQRVKYSQLLIVVGLAIAVGGIIQYFLFPDLLSLVPFGWDAHLYRLAGTFLDPGFTGILLVLAFLFTYHVYAQSYSKVYFSISAVILLSLLLTYSRASYLAFLLSTTLMAFHPIPFQKYFRHELLGQYFNFVDHTRRKSKYAASRRLHLQREHRKLLVGIIIVFLGAIPFLPRPRGEGVRLERTTSVYQRVDNYNSTANLVSVSPLFGIGYNNTCRARMKFGVYETGSHSCSGTDSSLLLLLITTGIVGLISFGFHIVKQARFVINPLITSSFVAVLSHSLFQNSLLYPWVLGWFAIIVSIEESKL